MTKGTDDGELIVNHTKSQSEKVDVVQMHRERQYKNKDRGQTQLKDKGKTQPYKSSRFIIIFPLLLLS